MTTVNIEFTSDFICPWCYIGKARLERVKTLLQNEINLDIELKPFVLYPHIPKEGMPKSVFAKKVKPGMGKSLKIEAATENIEINYRNIERIPYSLEAHRLIWLAEGNDIKYELAVKIFHGYFEEGKNIENHDYLIELAKSVGVSKAIIGKFFATNIGKKEVMQSIQNSKEEFISVVPSIKLDKQFSVPGLQSTEVWLNYIRRAAEIQLQKQ